MWHKRHLSTWLCIKALFCLAASSATAQEKQPSLPDNVQKRAVVIWSEGTRLAGDLYFPKGWNKEDKLPVIVCCNGWGGTKQNTTGRVAARLAKAGYVALAFDYRGWGDSDSKLVLKEKMPRPDEKGEVTVKVQAIREVVDPFDEALDIRHAIDYLMGEPGADRKRIGLWGTSYGGGLVTWSAAHDGRVKCVVAQVAAMGLLTEANRKKAEERAAQQARGEIGPIPQEYDRPAKLRGYGNLAKMIGYNALEAATKVKAPVLFIDAQEEELFDRLEHGKKAHDILAANKVPTEYRVIKGITHYGIYREGFEEATTLAVEWFDAHLNPGRKAESSPK
jgi:dienelactone hydrolase